MSTGSAPRRGLAPQRPSLNIVLEFARAEAAVRELLRTSPGIALRDDPAKDEYPMPLIAHDRDAVGRRRAHAAELGE